MKFTETLQYIIKIAFAVKLQRKGYDLQVLMYVEIKLEKYSTNWQHVVEPFF